MYLSAPSTVYWVLCIGYCVLFTVYCELCIRYWVLCIGNWVLCIGYLVLGTVYWVQGTVYCVLCTEYYVLVYLIKCTRYCVKLKGEVNILLWPVAAVLYRNSSFCQLSIYLYIIPFQFLNFTFYFKRVILNIMFHVSWRSSVDKILYIYLSI